MLVTALVWLLEDDVTLLVLEDLSERRAECQLRRRGRRSHTLFGSG